MSSPAGGAPDGTGLTMPDAGSHAVVDGVDVDAVHDAVVRCPGVAGLGSGQLGALATYLPGRRVPGVRVSPDGVQIEIRTEWDAPARDVFRAIRAALAAVVPDRPVDVTLADIELPASAADPGLDLPELAASELTDAPELTAAPERPALPAAPSFAPGAEPLPASPVRPESETT